MSWGLYIMGLLGPFWPNSNVSKRGQGGSSEDPKPQVGPPEPVLAPKQPKNHLRTQIGHNSVDGLWQPLEATRSAPSKDSPPAQGKTFLSSMHSVLRTRSGAYMI
ncbi:hypothetical protein O181_073938 [Austropuccinia psidii MF-1]|uniref:Uncharacterized protein n=1 Tax=Austropuccinia psidii MF-1 TaxID=1389203 RepID=A0A9Q3FA29_9BASI|nr:hypothetical protein [Austropuccinia psidii MF-1]